MLLRFASDSFMQDLQSVLDTAPEALPALLHARKVQRRAVAVGFEYPDLAGALADLGDGLVVVQRESMLES